MGLYVSWSWGLCGWKVLSSVNWNRAIMRAQDSELDGPVV